MADEIRTGPASGALPDAPPGDETAPRGSWLRPAALFLLTLGFSALEPSVLVGVPYILLLLVFPARRLPALIAGGLAVVLAFGPAPRDGLWFAERGWAVLVGGWFVTVTLRWPAAGFTGRALGAVGGALAVCGTILAVNPGAWGALDWLVSERIRSGVAAALEAYRAIQGEEGAVSSALAVTLYQTADLQAAVFPALVGLASMAGLGVAWWVYVRLAHEDGRGLGPVRDFRFNDQLVWLFLGGLGLLALGIGEGWTRAGSNAVVFMGALYALRGVAVVVFFNGGVSLFGAVLLALGLLFVAPVIVVGALVIGLGDTWLDLRSRARELVA